VGLLDEYSHTELKNSITICAATLKITTDIGLRVWYSIRRCKAFVIPLTALIYGGRKVETLKKRTKTHRLEEALPSAYAAHDSELCLA